MIRLVFLVSLLGSVSGVEGAAASPPIAGQSSFLPVTPAGTKTDVRHRIRAARFVRSRQPAAQLDKSAITHVEAANRAAVEEPRREAYVGASQVYSWIEGSLYRLYTAPGEVSDIALERGESLVSVAAGDTARWIIGDTSSGTGTERRTHVLVKPSAVGLATNLVISTDRRVYHVDLQSGPRTAMSSISWTYPEDSLLALKGAITAKDPSVASDVAVDALNFDYKIEGDRPPWRPIRAFDDGHQVFIEFPPTILESEAPPLFVTGESGHAELVNYRQRGRYYAVDRLFSAAELRLGERHQQVVRIVRENPVPSKGRKSS